MRSRPATRCRARERRRTWSAHRRNTRSSVEGTDMRIQMKTSRREFLKSLGALSAAGVVSNLDLLGGFANVNAQQATDYKALVCVFLYGGVDGNNVVVPTDAAAYAQYAAVRTTASGINLPLASLHPIQPASLATPFGLHP